MEVLAIQKFLCENLAEGFPQEEGLYLYLSLEDKNIDPDYSYPQVHLVEIRNYKGTLLADSDSWHTFLPVQSVFNHIEGLWTKRLFFLA